MSTRNNKNLIIRAIFCCKKTKNIIILTNLKYKKAFLKTLSRFNKVFEAKKSKN